MVELVLIYAVLNVALGYALAVSLADPPFLGFSPAQAFQHLRGFFPWEWCQQLGTSLPTIRPGSPALPSVDTEVLEKILHDAPLRTAELAPLERFGERPSSGIPTAAGAEELPPAWREWLEADQFVPCRFADGVAHALRLQLAAYRQHALAAETRARLVLAQENAQAVEQLVADFRFLHHEWLARLLQGAELLGQRRGRLGPEEQAAHRLEALLYDHAARMESIDRAISEINFKTDIVLGCRRLLEELFDLVSGIHLLRDDLTTSLSEILCSQRRLTDLPREQQLDPLTGRLNRLGLAASFRPADAPRQAVLVAWDSFHRVNQRLGTTAGDRVLRTFSQLLADLLQGCRASAEIVRLGGTRFLLLFDGLSPEEGTCLAEQVRQSLEATTLHWQGTDLDASARMGISPVEPDDSLPALLARLEEALDEAELAGRNRCAIVDGRGPRVVAPHQVPVIARRVEVAEAGELAAYSA